MEALDCAFSLRRLFHEWLQLGKLSHEFITRPGVESWNFKSWEGAGTSYRSTGIDGFADVSGFVIVAGCEGYGIH